MCTGLAHAPVSRALERLFIDGTFVPPETPKYAHAFNPFTGRAWAQAPEASPADVDKPVTAARCALNESWGQFSGAQRADVLRHLARLVEDNV